VGASDFLAQHLSEIVIAIVAWLFNRTVGRLDEDIKEIKDALPDIQIDLAILKAANKRRDEE